MRKWFVRADDWRNGDRRLAYLPEVDRACSLPPEEIRDYQWTRLLATLRWAYGNTEFYRHRLDSAGVDVEDIKKPTDLLRIPPLTKEDLRRSQVQLRSSGIDLNECFKTGSGGTTDSPITLYLDRESWWRRRAATLHFSRWFGYEIGDRIAYLWGAEQDFPSVRTLKSRIRDWLVGPTLWLPSSYLNDRIMEGYYRQLRRFRPKVLQAYPTPLYLFALFLTKHQLRLHIPFVNVVAEILYDYQRETINEVFQTKVFNWYGARELGHVATECREHQGMHINAYGLYVEVVKEGRHVEDEMGELIVTDLFNRVMPLIRYRIGDMGRVSLRPCVCGSGLPLLEEIGGRVVETFKKRDGSSIPGISFTNRIIKDYQGIEKLQIIQKDYEKFQLNIVRGPRYCEGDLKQLQQRICEFMHSDLSFDTQFVDDIPPEKSGKVIFCKSEVRL